MSHVGKELLEYLRVKGFDNRFLEAIQRDPPSLTVINALMMNVENFVAERGKLETQILALKVQSQIARPSHYNQAEHEELISSLKSEIEDNRLQLGELVRVKAANEKLECQLKEAEFKIKELEFKCSEIGRLKACNSELDEQIKLCELKCKNLVCLVQELNAERETAETVLYELDEGKKILLAQLAEVKWKFEAAKKDACLDNQELKELKTVLAVYKSKCKNLENVIHQLESSRCSNRHRMGYKRHRKSHRPPKQKLDDMEEGEIRQEPNQISEICIDSLPHPSNLARYHDI